MYVCMYEFMYVNVMLCMCVCMYVGMYEFMYAYVMLCMCVCMYAYQIKIQNLQTCELLIMK